MDLIVRFDYGSIIPWVRRVDGVWTATAGPDSLSLRTAVALEGVDFATRAAFTVKTGERVPFVLTWAPSHQPPRTLRDPFAALDDTLAWWSDWAKAFSYEGPWKEQVLRSAITLKGLTFAPTGGIVAAATTSLPEKIGGVRNWDYRFCWLRDATFTLFSLINCGFLTRSGRVAQLAASCCRRRSGQAADHVRRRRRAAAARADARLAARVRRIASPSGSATPRSTSSSWTSTARCSTRCTSRATPASSPTDSRGRSRR